MARKKSVVDFEIKGQNGLTKIGQLEAKVKTLRKEWRNASTAADRYAKSVEFKAANAEVRRHRQELYNTETAWQKFAKSAGSIATGVLGANLLSWASGILTQVIPGLINGSAKLSDEISDIQKNTGLLKSEVEDLNNDLKTINTRTSRSELRDLASVAGKMGKNTKEGVMEFVQQANMINVALGDVLGDDATTKLAKSAEVFDTSMLKIGSSINTIGANSNANEGYLVDFLARLGGTAATAKIAAPDIIGYGAVLDSLGLQVEMSGTAMSNFFLDFVKDTTKFEAAAGMQKGALDALIGEKGTNEGFIAFIENLKAASTSESDFLKKLEEVGVNGSRGAAVFLSLSNNVEKLRSQQDIANKSFTDGTSILEEYNIKNNNQAAILEKIGKWWSSFTTSSSIRAFVDDITIRFGKLIGVVQESTLATQEYLDKSTQIKDYEKDLIPLIERYEQLESKTNKSAFEQNELEKIISQIAGIVPSAVTQVDQYGNAMAISTGKTKQFVEQQKAMLKYLNKTAIAEIESELTSLNQEFSKLDRQANSGVKFVTDYVGIGGKTTQKALTNQDLQGIRGRQSEIGNRKKELELAKRGLSGDYEETKSGLNNPTTTFSYGPLGVPTVSSSGTVSSSVAENPNGTVSSSEVENKATQAAQKELEELKRLEAKRVQILQEYDQEVYRNNLSTADREIVDIMLKYEKIIEATEVGSAKEKEVREAMAKEISLAVQQHEIDGLESTIAETERINEENYESEKFKLELRHATSMEDQALKNLEKLELEEEYLMAQLLLKEAFAEETQAIEAALLKNSKKQQLEQQDFEDKLYEDKKQAEEDLRDAKVYALQDGVAALRGMFAETSGVYKALFLVEKAAAIAQIIISNNKEVAYLRAAQAAQVAAASSTVFGIAATPAINALFAAKIIKSRIEAGIAVGNIVAQGISQVAKKKDGGFTDMESLGYTNGPKLYGTSARPYIAGEAGQEFVTSAQSLQNPAVADFTRLLDVAQKSGDYSSLNSFGSSNTNIMLAELSQNQKQTAAAIAMLSKRPIVFNYKPFEDFQDFLFQIKEEVTA